MRNLIIATFLDKNGIYLTAPVVAKKTICYRCDGEGKHVNPAIDQGLTLNDLENQEFREAYMGGDYDVECEICKGDKIVLVPDEEAMSNEEREDYYRYLDCVAREQAEDAAERKWGC